MPRRTERKDAGAAKPLRSACKKTYFADKSAQTYNIALYDIKFFNSDNLNIEYCIIDDDKDMLDKQMNNFVHIDNYTGITDNDIEKIKQILNIVQDN